jgi:hypothetical protein
MFHFYLLNDIKKISSNLYANTNDAHTVHALLMQTDSSYKIKLNALYTSHRIISYC